MTDEEKWEEWRNANAEIQKPYGKSVHKHIIWYQGADRRKAFLDGLAEGRKEKWHDLRKNPNDLPKETVLVLFVISPKVVVIGWRSNENWIMDVNDRIVPNDFVVAWCEIPTFKE